MLDTLGATLLVNNSFSGSTVTKMPGMEYPSYGCSDKRTGELGSHDLSPDVVIVWMGMNDFGHKVAPRASETKDDFSVFENAYRVMLEKIKRNYSSAEIWCFTFCLPKNDPERGFTYTRVRGGVYVDEFCRVIRECADALGCITVDLFDEGREYSTVDGLHPDNDGMKTVSAAVLDALCGQ